MEATAEFNSVFVVTSLAEHSLQTGERLLRDDLAPRAKGLGVRAELHRVTNLTEFRGVVEGIRKYCETEKNAFPILHLDTHGSDHGIVLVPSDEVMSWAELAHYCRDINVACRNNLLVTTGLCFGLLSITAIDIKQPTPFFALIGPEETVTAGEVDAFGSFYAGLLDHGDAYKAMEKLSGKFGLFLAERLFLNAVAGYFRSHCSGRERRQRVERLVTEAMQTEAGQKLGLTKVRATAKERTKPRAEVFERFKRGFLLSDAIGNEKRFECTFDQALLVVDLDE